MATSQRAADGSTEESTAERFGKVEVAPDQVPHDPEGTRNLIWRE
jgi:hypothetical protein